MKKEIFALCTIALLAGCGGNVEEKSEVLDANNFVTVAKNVYAQQAENTLEQLPAPGAKVEETKIYLSQVVKPRDTKVTFLQAKQGDNTLIIHIDDENKYATITLNGDTEHQHVVDMKTFTTKQ